MRLGHYIDCFTDFGFKRLFGTERNKNLLLDFLNTVLSGKVGVIESINYMNDEQLGRGKNDRKAIYDLMCKSENGTQFIVELQRESQKFFKDRLVFYSTFPIMSQADRGDAWAYQLMPVYVIGIVNFVLYKNSPDKFCHYASIRDDDTNESFSDALHFVLLEMPKFKKGLSELDSHFEKWIFAMNHLSELHEKPVELHEKVFDQFFEEAAVAKLSSADYRAYQYELKVARDNYSVFTTAIENAEAKGRAEGQAEIIRNMRVSGMTDEAIARIVGMSIGDIQSL